MRSLGLPKLLPMSKVKVNMMRVILHCEIMFPNMWEYKVLVPHNATVRRLWLLLPSTKYICVPGMILSFNHPYDTSVVLIFYKKKVIRSGRVRVQVETFVCDQGPHQMVTSPGGIRRSLHAHYRTINSAIVSEASHTHTLSVSITDLKHCVWQRKMT